MAPDFTAMSMAQTLETPSFFPHGNLLSHHFPKCPFFSKAPHRPSVKSHLGGRLKAGLKLGWKRLCLSEYKTGLSPCFTSGIAKITSSLSADRLVWKAATISNQPCRLEASPSGHQDNVQLFPNLLVHILIFRCLAISYGPRLGTHKRDCCWQNMWSQGSKISKHGFLLPFDLILYRKFPHDLPIKSLRFFNLVNDPFHVHHRPLPVRSNKLFTFVGCFKTFILVD